jgi:ribose 5-phosphate isomerase B
VVGQSLAEELIRTFIEAKFSRDERHVRRLDKIRALEA